MRGGGPKLTCALRARSEYMLWTDAGSREFIATNYPWFLSAFDGYPYPIQRADAIRYFVLHHYGGIYMDLDVGCQQRMDPLLYFPVSLLVRDPLGRSCRCGLGALSPRSRVWETKPLTARPRR